MLPNLHIPTIKIFGVIPIQPFGVLVAIAVITGFQLGRRRARALGLDAELCGDGMVWMVMGGFILAHIVSEIFYYPDDVAKNPLTLLAFWRGLSSFGGFAGATAVAFYFFRRKGVSVLEYGEAILFGFVPAWVIGRMGCTIVFDHPGTPTRFILGMADSSGVVRHNLGMYEMLFAIFLTITLYALRNRRPFNGFYAGIMMLLYGPVRFSLDMLRVADTRYGGFTPGQFLSIAMTLLAIYLLARGYLSKSPNR